MSNTATAQNLPYSNETERVLIEMMTENTGRHMLDSGGAYGRNWEQNQDLGFVKAPAVELSDYGVYVSHNVYHWLKERVTYDEELDTRFQEFCKGREDTHWLQDMEEFAESLEASGLYGDGNPFTVNTYNGECSLSQTLQFTYFELNGTSYIALQIHGGCDVRGGYTRPRIFEVDDDGVSVLCFADGHVGCSECDAAWYTDNGGYNWYPSDREDEFKGDDLEAVDGKFTCPACGEGHLIG
jgi:hypothetical protein